MNRYGYGEKGEALAKAYLEKNGYKIVAQNVRYQNVGEIDIVALDGGILAFIEVKNRFDANFGNPFDAVTKQKQKKIISASRRFLTENKIRCRGYRYDVVGILGERVELIKDAFMAKW